MSKTNPWLESIPAFTVGQPHIGVYCSSKTKDREEAEVAYCLFQGWHVNGWVCTMSLDMVPRHEGDAWSIKICGAPAAHYFIFSSQINPSSKVGLENILPVCELHYARALSMNHVQEISEDDVVVMEVHDG